jgi:hypothetical protein
MPPRRGPQCSLLCSEPVTYSERGHPLAGDYCDKHGLAVHRLRRGSPCPCGHCDGARGRVQRKIEREAVEQAAEPNRAEEPDAD